MGAGAEPAEYRIEVGWQVVYHYCFCPSTLVLTNPHGVRVKTEAKSGHGQLFSLSHPLGADPLGAERPLAVSG